MIKIKRFFAIGSLCWSGACFADQFSYAGFLAQEEPNRKFLELGYRGTPIYGNDILTVSSAAQFTFDNSEDKVKYGFNTSVGATVGDTLQAYIGGGAFFTQNERCNRDSDGLQYRNENDCEVELEGGVYPELSFQLVTNTIVLGMYARVLYTFSGADETGYAVGFLIGNTF